MAITPNAWKGKHSLIEYILPAQKVSAEAQKERKAGAGQTLTSLGSYWKGRKPLVLVKACILGALLPETDNSEKDLAIFEKLMAMDDEAFLRRQFKPSCLDVAKRLIPLGCMSKDDAESLIVVERYQSEGARIEWKTEPFTLDKLDEISRSKKIRLAWGKDIAKECISKWQIKWVQSFDYLERVSGAKRPEELDQIALYAPIWDEVNKHLGVSATSIPELVEQLGVLRFGTRPKVGDPFCGGGSIPFEAARMGCDVYASDLNPIACMLTWGALNIIGANKRKRQLIEEIHTSVIESVIQEMDALDIEYDDAGNKAKAYLYCLETRCPHTGWRVPLFSSQVISTKHNVIARLVPNKEQKCFDIDVVTGVSHEDLATASTGTVQDGDLVYSLYNEEYRTPIKTIRGDYRLHDGSTGNRLRKWSKSDFIPSHDDIFQERLFCIQWITKDTLGSPRPKIFFATVNEDDLAREQKVESIIRENLINWQKQGLIPDMPIEPGTKTDEPIRTRGWTYWHHLFSPRQILLLYILNKNLDNNPLANLILANELNFHSKLCGINPRTSNSGREMCIDRVFINQALNTLTTYGVRSSAYLADNTNSIKWFSLPNVTNSVKTKKAADINSRCSYWITDPPYGDAVYYHEITEYFISWLRGCPREEFKDWIWDSRRALAIQGKGENFRSNMISSCRAMAEHMPDNGMQIVMFTHQDAGVWADLAAIVWGAGLRVSAAWYIATETTSELKKGGYVQGTVLLVLRKRLEDESAYRDELVEEVRNEVSRQIDTMTGLNQRVKGNGRAENLFEDADLQMAGYAAALRVLTGYRHIDGRDMTSEALRPRHPGEVDLVKEIIDFAVQVANEHLVPEGMPPKLWDTCSGSERFYLKMLELEADGLKKLDNYQNFAKAFRVSDYGSLMGSVKPNSSRLKRAGEFKKVGFDGEFGCSPLRAVLFALWELQKDIDCDEVMQHLRDMIPSYHSRREDLMAFCQYIAQRRESMVPDEAQAARILMARIKNERLG